MGLGKTFEEAFTKAQIAACQATPESDPPQFVLWGDTQAHR
jgi:hypothetical protein